MEPGLFSHIDVLPTISVKSHDETTFSGAVESVEATFLWASLAVSTH
jgi:hypothetical protein